MVLTIMPMEYLYHDELQLAELLLQLALFSSSMWHLLQPRHTSYISLFQWTMKSLSDTKHCSCFSYVVSKQTAWCWTSSA